MKRMALVVCLALALTLLLAGCSCEHEYQAETTVAASCTQAGVKTFTCTLCKHSYTKSINILDHSYVPIAVEKAATCTEEGIQKYSCTDCGNTKTEPLKKLAHTFGEEKITQKANCSDEGILSATCTVCNATLAIKSIPKNDQHIYTNKVIREATCSDHGEGMNICSLCGHSETCNYPLKDHQYGKGVITVAPTCTNKGSKQFTCSRCNHIHSETIKASGHTWVVTSCDTPKSCSSCGYKDTKAAGHTYITVKEAEATQHYAGIRVQQCQNCSIEKTIYLGRLYEYDLEAIRDELADYALSQGFQVTFIGEEGEYPFSSSTHFFLVDATGRGPDYIVKMGKSSIDFACHEYRENSTVGLEVYTMYINVYYTSSAMLGSGYFNIDIFITS